jgi:hypothetical protein
MRPDHVEVAWRRLFSAMPSARSASGSIWQWLAVVAGNTRARRFYARNGWRDAGLFEHEAPIEGGSISLAAHRYEKRTGTSRAGNPPEATECR